MNLPSAFLNSLNGAAGFDAERFLSVHTDPVVPASVRINPVKNTACYLPAPVLDKVPWNSSGYYLDHRPNYTFDPLFHAGAYYVQEASGMYIEQVLSKYLDNTRSLRVLDLCAAPGGKSTILQSFISSNSLLVSNETIKARSNILNENLIKWGYPNVIVTNNDPKDFSRLEGYFDVILVDAPCSGSGLFRREPEAASGWSEELVQLCSRRQKRILEDVWPSLKENGILIYSTCSYSPAENEQVADWVMSKYSTESLPVKPEEQWKIVESFSENNAIGYRFYPDRLKGEGLYITAFRKTNGNDNNLALKKSQIDKIPKKESDSLKTYLAEFEKFILFRQDERILALPSVLQQDLSFLQKSLYLKKAGIVAGKFSHDEFIPDHGLAISNIIHSGLPTIELGKEDALKYLRKEEMDLSFSGRGWFLVQHQQLYLGWVKLLEKRINNYYPKEWRILKRSQ